MSIRFENVSFYYENKSDKNIIENISFEINDGEFVAIMGRTGCGKTTVLQLIAGLIRPSKGKVLLDEEDINEKGYDRSVIRKRLA